MNVKIILRTGALVFVLGSVTVVDAQTAAPAGGGMAPGAAGLTSTNPGVVAQGNNSGGTAPAPVYSGPAAASGANSPPVNSGITDPKTGANNDTRPLSGSEHTTSDHQNPPKD
jgi:hypothetical protein